MSILYCLITRISWNVFVIKLKRDFVKCLWDDIYCEFVLYKYSWTQFNSIEMKWIVGCAVVWLVALLACSTVGLQLEGPGFESQPGVLMNGVYRSQGISCDNKIKP